MSGAHIPVMLDEVMAALEPRDGAVYVDGTFGGGSYTAALLSRAECSVVGIDRDAAAIERGGALAERYAPRLTLIHGRFSEMEALLGARGLAHADGIALDLGVSSFQLDQRERGFSFRDDGPLDMRMDASQGPTAADLVNTLGEDELIDILRRYGEEKRAKHIVRAIIAARPIQRTSELAALVERVLGKGGRIHAATRTFQALRIAVNAELEELETGLEAAERLLNEGGRLAVVSFHSLEDRIVKQFLAERTGRLGRGSRHMPDDNSAPAPSFAVLAKSQENPSQAEIEANPRARSARLRTASRTAAPAWKSSPAARGAYA